MKKILWVAILFVVVACTDPETKADNTKSVTDTTRQTETEVLNSPPGGASDTSGGVQMDTSHRDKLK